MTPAPANPSHLCAHWLLPKLSCCTTAEPQAPASPGSARGIRAQCLMFFFTWSLRTMVRCRQVQYMSPALLAYFVTMYELDTFNNLVGETLHWIHQQEIKLCPFQRPKLQSKTPKPYHSGNFSRKKIVIPDFRMVKCCITIPLAIFQLAFKLPHQYVANVVSSSLPGMSLFSSTTSPCSP